MQCATRGGGNKVVVLVGTRGGGDRDKGVVVRTKGWCWWVQRDAGGGDKRVEVVGKKGLWWYGVYSECCA